MIRQFTFHKPKEILQPTLWLFLSQACSMLPAILAYMAIYTLGEAFVPPYTLDLFRLITLAALGVGCFVLQYIVELISYYFTYGKAYRDTADKRIAYIQKLRRQPLGFFSSKESGELISSFSNDFANVEYTLCYWLPYPLGVGALLAISIVWICVYDWRMGLAMFGMLPVCALLMLLVAKVKEKHSGRVMEAKAHAATQINEYLRGMKDLKAYHRTGEGFDTLKKAMGNLRDESLKDEAVAGSLSNLCASLVRFIVPVTVAVGMYLLLGGSLGILDFAGFLVLATKLVEAELMLVASISALRGMAPSGRRLDAVMTTPEPTGEAEIGHGDAYMFENVSFRYGEGLDVIRDVSFETPAGSLTALVGPSGSGKSTLLRLMARFWDYQMGHIRMEKRDIREIRTDSLLAQISMVMQNAYLFHGSLRENLCFGNETISEERMVEACRRACCHEFISALPEGYDTVIAEDGGNISQGQKQLLCIARVMLCLPPMLILDEATSSIDTRTEVRIQKAFARMMQGRTSFIVAHRLSTIREADVILVMKDGHIVEQGSHDVLLAANGFYAKLYNSQFEGVET